MLPAAYQTPAALMLVLAGLVACFFGYRLFRGVLALFGFLLGAFAASSFFGAGSTTTLLVAACVGGLVGAGLLLTASVVGVALVGAALGATVAHVVSAAADGGPGVLTVVLFTTAGAIGATYLQRYFIVVGTGFGGAWTLVVGAMALAEEQALGAAARDVWVLYPLDPAPGRWWVPVVWMALGVMGVAVQLGWTGGERGRVGRRRRNVAQ
jgi:Domain of unknown function (DUF4203)